MTQETYTLKYEVDLLTDNPRTSTYSNLTITQLIENLLYLSANNILAFGDALYILDADGSHIYNSIDFINENVEFQVLFKEHTYPSEYEWACVAVCTAFPDWSVQYRPKGTHTWETFTND